MEEATSANRLDTMQDMAAADFKRFFDDEPNMPARVAVATASNNISKPIQMRLKRHIGEAWLNVSPVKQCYRLPSWWCLHTTGQLTTVHKLLG